MKTRRMKLVVSYDGTDFSGWQVQARGRTVQGTLEEALARMHKHPVRLTGAGRTDSGVHAAGQAAHFETDIQTIPPANFVPALNRILPNDVRVLKSKEVRPCFHARYSAVRRVYRYTINCSPHALPQENRYAYHLRRGVNITLLNRMASQICGVHDFATFGVPDEQSKSSIRTVYNAAFFPQGKYVIFLITGRAFLWRMVRSLVGTILELSEDGAGEEGMRKLLELKDRTKTGTTAPSHGLCLSEVVYDEQ